MKLHLTKGLLVALIAAAAQTMAADLYVNGYNGGTDSFSRSGEWAVGVKLDASSTDNTASASFAQGDSVTLNAAMGAQLKEDIQVDKLNLNALLNLNGNNGHTLTANEVNVNSGGTLNVNDNYSLPLMLKGGSVTVKENKTLTLNEGSSLASGSVTVNAGSTLNVTTDVTLGKGSSSSSYDATITLNGGATLAGDGSVALQSGQIKAVGTGNIVSVDLKQDWRVNVDVAQGGDLTLSGGLVKTKDGANFLKTGDGTLKIASTATIDAAYAMSIDDGTLDLSDVATLKLDSLTLAAGTTIILGENTRIEITNALTIGSGVVFDVSSWCAYDEYDPYALFSFTGSESKLSLPESVTIHTSTGDNTQAWLEYDAENKTVMLMPEPTTTTLSLLALAGLAARRRRK